MTSETTAAIIERKLKAGLSPSRVEVVDDSDRHAGHAGARAGGGHFLVTIVAGVFEGMGRLERHRLVHGILDQEMKGAIHALALKALTPAEWKNRTTVG